MSAVQDFLDRLDGVKRSGSGWIARCPVPGHGKRRGDLNRSLAVSSGEKQDVVAHCHAGCSFEQIADAMGWSASGNGGPATTITVATYDYHGENGQTLFQVVRYAPKRFAQRRPDGPGGWIWNMEGVRRVPYRLPALINAVQRQDLVFVVEGEKDVHALMEHGATATTNPGGAGKWPAHFKELFRGADVVIIADRDEVGYAHANDVKRNLSGIAQNVTVVEAAEGKDAADHLAAGYGVMDFVPVQDTKPAERKDDAPPATIQDYGVVTDAANATRLHKLHSGTIRFVAKWGTWLAWDGTRWARDDKATLVSELAKDVGREIYKVELPASGYDNTLAKWAQQSLQAARIAGMLTLARGLPGILLDHEALDADPWLLGVRNGVVDLRTGTLRSARPEDLMTMQAQVEYNVGATSPRWDRALAEWFPDHEVREYVQRIVGAALVGEQRDHVFVIHFGHGANGKGTFIRAVANILGPYAVTPHMSLLVAQRGTEHDTVKASLFRARLAVASETARRVTLAEASVKNLTGRDRISCRRLYENPWEFEPSHSLWLQTNHLPRITGRDHGIWRRIRVVPWTQRFKPAAEDLDATLAAEAAGILAWAVEGTRLWLEHGLAEPQAVLDATLQYRQNEDVFASFQKDTGLVFEGSITVADINRRYKAWADEQDVKPRMVEFRDWLAENGADQEHSGLARTRTYRGVTIPGELL